METANLTSAQVKRAANYTTKIVLLEISIRPQGRLLDSRCRLD
jgi:hypothetical protein